MCLNIFLGSRFFILILILGNADAPFFGYSAGVGGVSVQSIAMNNENATLNGHWKCFLFFSFLLFSAVIQHEDTNSPAVPTHSQPRPPR